ncbi:hypothetical protein IF690_02185 [Pseudomonas sp. SK3(2021)]|uniref:hypothetical protein n=1 Tax=Pseudomonas sp. SK3(2021) TaxID=2841064 RepID=UPI00192AE47F|nr:hypothetical protein [Pseudomonas sp. SK3(2021)]QQZ42369.1 hypothetical protein IF690_02185 [Pseudomonas sp. SK3(2021)]
MLTVPFTDLPYQPTIASLLAGIDTEYKNENYKIALLKLDPNNHSDRKTIITDYILHHQNHLTYRHKLVLIEELKKTITEKEYDFNSLFEYNYDTEEYSSSPWPANEIITPRSFFEDILNTAQIVWNDDLVKAALEDRSTW